MKPSTLYMMSTCTVTWVCIAWFFLVFYYLKGMEFVNDSKALIAESPEMLNQWLGAISDNVREWFEQQ